MSSSSCLFDCSVSFSLVWLLQVEEGFIQMFLYIEERGYLTTKADSLTFDVDSWKLKEYSCKHWCKLCEGTHIEFCTWESVLFVTTFSDI